ncbi:MAG: DUF3575 domain-containing protein [Bacteroidales bacterium]|nr:DUF3575 domain-containing protein [Bacteroidales bacterium]
MNKAFVLSLLLAAALVLPGGRLGAQSVALSTNAADYANLGTFNIDASYGFIRHWSVSAAVRYNPFTFGKGEDAFQAKQRSVSAGFRWWPWHIYSGWWTGARAQWQEYRRGGFSSQLTSEGDRFGGVIQAGYAFMLNKHLNLDIGISLWAGYDKYKTYSCPNCGTVLVTGAKYFALPDDLIVSIAYIF